MVSSQQVQLLQLLEGQAMSPLFQPQLPPCPQCSCSEDTGGQLLCMEVYVFVFCIVVSALASGLVVASKGLLERINAKFKFNTNARIRLRRTANVPNPHLKRVHASGSAFLEAGPERRLAQADRAAAAAAESEHEGMLPARYVRAFCGKEHHAAERWKATLAWRKENEIDRILNEPQPFFHDIRRYFPSYMSGRSRGGHIVVYEKLGEVDMPSLGQLGITVPMLLRHWIFVSEYMYRVLQPTDAAQQVTVEDMQGVKLQSVAGKVQEYVKGAAQLARLYYVERCHKTFVVNAPAWFGLAFRIVSPFLSARTRQKIRILGTDLSPLHDEIDPQYLPLEYGGKNTVPVFDSAEERHLRHLVDTMNANADAHPDGRKKPKSPINMKKAKTNPATPSKTVSKHRKDNKTPVSGGRKKGAAEPANGGTRTPEEKEAFIAEPMFVSSEPRRRNLTAPNATRRARASTYEGTIVLPAHRGATFVRRASWSGSDGRDTAHDVDDVDWAAAAATHSVRATLEAAACEPRDGYNRSDNRPLGDPDGDRGMMSSGTKEDAAIRRRRPSARRRAENRGTIDVRMERGSMAGRDSGDSGGEVSRAPQLRGQARDGGYQRGVVEAQDEENLLVQARVQQVTKDLGVSSDDYDHGHEDGRGHGSLMGDGGDVVVVQKVEMAGSRDDRRLG